LALKFLSRFDSGQQVIYACAPLFIFLAEEAAAILEGFFRDL
jgi:hypothetical protein